MIDWTIVGSIIIGISLSELLKAIGKLLYEMIRKNKE